MNVYVINLEEATERKKSIVKQLETLGIKAVITKAVNGRSLTHEQLVENVDLDEVQKHPDWLTPGVLGCALSHRNVYKQIVEENSTWNLVLEDDAILDDKLPEILLNVERNPELYKDRLTLLYTISRALYGPVVLSRKALHNTGSYEIHQVLSKSPAGAGAYIIHKDVAAKFLESDKLVKVAPDTWQYFLKQGVYSQINCTYPFAARPGFFESTIGYVKDGSILHRIKRFVDKHKLPPFYAFLRWNRKRIWEKTSVITFE